MTIQKPNDPYSTEWTGYWAANPGMSRGIGAEAVAAEASAVPAQAATPAAEPVKTEPVKTSAAATPEVSAADLKTASSLLDGDWREDLPDDLKETAKRFTSKADAVRAIADFRKRESQVRVPGANATPEEKAAYAKAIGIPEKAEAYEFDNVEGLELTDQVKAEREEWGKRFHALGLPKETAKALSKFANEDAKRQLQAAVEADKTFAKQQEDTLRNEWKGDEYERNKTLANRAFSEVANRAGLNLEDLTRIETKDGRFLMDRAEIIKIFSVIGREMSEGSIGPTLTESEKDTVDDQIREVRSAISEAQSSGDSKRANTLYQREQALIAKRGGNKPVVGARGRML